MQKNDKSYTFLLSHSSKSKIYIKRISVSKSYVHFGTIGIFLFIGITLFGLGISGIVRNTVYAQSLTTDNTAIMGLSAALTTKATEPIDYSRPPAASELAVNSGGPEEDSKIGDEDNSLEDQLRAMETGTNPSYLPTMWAHLGKINNEFGFRRNPFGGRTYEFHPGIDIDGERGDLVVAPANGSVIKAGYTGGYGNMVEIDHGNGLTTRYGHLSKIESSVGDTVSRGQLIAYVGSTGRSTGPHLHYELRLNDRPINPRHFLPPEPTDLTKIVR
jgi:murein DD-endopeptidase MepM/ murein hydrolase activator NlpD